MSNIEKSEFSDLKKELLEKMKKGLMKKDSIKSTKVQKKPDNVAIPLSFQQQRMWFINKLVSDCAAYNIPLGIRLKGNLDVTLLEESVNEVIKRHETLRTVFKSIEGEAHQVVLPQLKINFINEDLRSIPSDIREHQMLKLIKEAACRTFNLEMGPLLRANLWRMKDDEYVLLLNIHHIIADTWSVSIFIHEMCAFYEAGVKGEKAVLPEMSLQYSDFAYWQRQYLAGDELEDQMSYWSKQLEGAPTVLALPTDKARPTIEKYEGDIEFFNLSSSITGKLNEFAKKYDVTLFMLLMAAYEVWLHHYTGQNDILVGTQIANRNRADFEKLIGFFSNTLVIRGNLSDDPTFEEYVRRVKEVTLNAYEHQEIPFEKIVDKLKIERDMGRNPLFQVMFVLQNTPYPQLKFSDITMETIEFHNGTCKFDLWLSIVEEGGKLRGALEYNSTIFERKTALRIIDNFTYLLEEILSNPKKQISNFTSISKYEKDKLLIEWNNTSKDYGEEKYLHKLIERCAELNPNRQAVVFEGESISYQQLNERANQLAHFLKKKGVKEDTLVGICMERSIEMVVSLLGVLKAGGAYVPLDPTLPFGRLEFMVNDSDVSIILTQNKFKEILSNKAEQCIFVDNDWVTLNQESTLNIENCVNMDNLAYMIYTSGSTGLPKGSLNTHRGICNRLLWMQEYFQINKDDRILQKTPYSFDVSVWEFFLPLLSGACLVVARPEGHKDNVYLMDLIKKEHITTIHFVPSMLRVFLEQDEVYTCDSIKRLICSGEALSFELQQKFFDRMKTIELFNLYGPTEAAVDVTYWKCERDSNLQVVPIGKPISNCKLYVLDNNLNPVPIGAIGELHIGGICLSRGYWRRNELTAEKFISNPFGAKGEKLYKTGDLVRYLEDGNICYIQRIDNQVKIKGFRIELGEIEENLLKHSAVQNAVVIAKEIGTSENSKLEGSLGKRLVAYIKPNLLEKKVQEELKFDELSNNQVYQWQNVFDMAYEKTASDDPIYNFSSWNSSYTNESLPLEDMCEWADETSAAIIKLRPRKVLEIGCGTGLILFRISQFCDSYTGTDISNTSLKFVEKMIKNKGMDETKFKLYNKAADELDIFDNEVFDVIILNSVIQYFPDIQYLLSVIKGLTKLLSPSGHIFIGDIRNNSLLSYFHNSLELFKIHSSASLLLFKEHVQRNIEMEEELTIKPQFFSALKKEIPEISQVEVRIKNGSYINELSKFRYDVIITVNDEKKSTCKNSVNWNDLYDTPITLLWLEQIFKNTDDEIIAFKNIRNQRLEQEVKLMYQLDKSTDTLMIAELKERVKEDKSDFGVSPDDVKKLAKRYNFEMYGFYAASGDINCFDAVFIYEGKELPPMDYGLIQVNSIVENEKIDWSIYSNNPITIKMKRQLIPELKNYLKDKLPEYMIPSYFVLIDEFPINSNGKLDYKKLPEPCITVTLEDNEYVAPSTPIEKKLAAVWEEVLGIERIGIYNNFFELGGDSILSIRVVARVNNQGITITPSQIFQNPTISQLAKVVSVASDNNEFDITTNPWSLISQDTKDKIGKVINIEELEDAYPLGPFQMYMLEKELNSHEHGIFVMEKIMSYDEEMNVELFNEAFQYVAAQHPIMRTSFLWDGFDEPIQLVHKKTELPFKYEDLTDYSPMEQQLRCQEYFREDEFRGLELNEPKPFRLYVIKYSPNSYFIVITNSYLCIDGWSLQVLMEEIFMVYNAKKENREIHTYPEHRSYRDFIAWTRKQDFKKSKEFWQGYMKGYNEPMAFINKIPGNKLNTGSGYVRDSLFINEQTTKAINLFSQRNKITPNAVIQAAYAILQSIYTGEEKVCYGNLVSGRPACLKSVESIMGTNLNIVPLYVKIEKDLNLISWLKEILDMQFKIRDYENVPIKMISDWIGFNEGQSIFESYIIFQNVVRISETEIQGAKLQPKSENCCLRLGYPLRVDVFPTSTQIAIMMTYNRKYFDEITIKNMMKDFSEIIETLLISQSSFVLDIYDQLIKRIKK